LRSLTILFLQYFSYSNIFKKILLYFRDA
jgi:hypothetical protein